MAKTFFKPFKGKRYEQGIQGKKVLVLGASFYCNHPDHCKYFASCTDTVSKDSSAFDAVCPYYVEDGLMLHDTPADNIAEEYKAYKNFADYLMKLVPCDNYEEAWDAVAFTNYVQFFLPAEEGQSRVTTPSDLSDRDFKAFLEVTKELRPDIVIIWGSVINSVLKEDNPYVVDADELEKNNWYICHMVHPETQDRICLVNPYHPSSSAWWSGLDEFDKYMHMAIAENNNINLKH